MSLSVGVDIGGTKIAAGLVDDQGQVLEQLQTPTPAEDPDALLHAVVSSVRELVGDAPVDRVGVAAAGFVDRSRTRILSSPNIAWRDYPLRTVLEDALELPVVVENDANAAAWGEFRFGVGRDVDDFLFISVGTGVGGGVVLDGELRRGAFGVAGEIGHVRVVRDGDRCGCGNRGCWEAYASGTALMRRALARLEAGEEGTGPLLARAGSPEDVTGPMLDELAGEGDPFAVAQIRELGGWLGEGLATLCAVLDPALVAVGGGVASSGELLLEPVRESLAQHQPGRGTHPLPRVVRATLGSSAGLVGAADLGRDRGR